MNIILKPTKKEEIEFLKELEDISFDVNGKYFEHGVLPPLSEKEQDKYSLKSMYGREGYSTLSIWGEKEIIGCAVVKDIDIETKEVALFFISPKWQGRKIGQKALEEVENYFPKIRKWRLETPTQVIRNAVFYVNKCGYSITKIIGLDKTNENGMFVFEKNK